MAYELEKVYSPKDAEDRIYANWVEKGYFRAEVDPNKKPFTIMMPPPNITGQLHMGHAMDLTLQDILTRVKRMQGYSALWLPGTDHAALATEVKIVEAMKAEGVTKADLGREGFLERAWKWKEQYGGRIVQQAKKMGSSCDWSRERFTMDEGCSEAVKKVFVNLYNKGLIYRGERIINWCPTCKTSLSDIEVEFSESEGNFWHLRYPLTDGSGELILATTRPETMLGDTAVAVHPDDERYKHLIGKTVTLPLVNREIPIVGDEYVEKDFGTGVVKITPAHDPNDFEVGQRHDLPIINVMNLDGSINEEFGGKYAGLDRYDARKAIVKDLEEGGYLVKIEPLSHNVGSCYRCNTVIEPMLSKQWFVKMQPLAEPAIKVVDDELTEFVPERFQKVYFNWMNNIRDWCISRQIWWGHRIPAFYCDECGELIVSADHVETCPKCGAKMRQDEDTLDTWFSSALWPFSTLGWPEKTEDLEYFYPTSVLVTGYDIIFFWVARMIFSGLEHTGETPFKHVYIHGLVRDSQGRKMSKSLGNGIDPLEIIDQYGADALRFTLVNGNSPGNDMRYSDEKVKASRNFANKLWNAARFILMNDVEDVVPDTLPEALALEDRWVLSQLNNVVKEVCANIDRYELGIAAAKISDFAWDVFCDWYIEIAKMRLNGDDKQSKAACKQVLIYVFTAILKMLHPFMPFVTEEIYCNIPHSCESIMISSYPEYDEKLNFPEDELAFEEIMQLIKQVRVARSEMNVPPSKRTKLYIETKHTEIFESGVSYIKRLASADHVEIGDSFDVPGAVQIVAATARGLIPMEDLVDKEKELARLGREKATCEKEIASLEGRLSNEQFTAKAPAKVVEGERAKLQAAKEKLALIEQSIAALN